MRDPATLRVGDNVDLRATPLEVVEVVYALQPATRRGLFRVYNPRVGLFYALKVFDLTAGNSERSVAQEVLALNKTLAHPEHFPKAHAFEVLGSWAFLLLDWMVGTPLSRYAQQAPRGPAELKLRVRLFQELCRVTGLVHKAGLAHRDLKPDNVLLRNPNDITRGLSIIDFGLSNEARRAEEGTLGFRAPEQESGRQLNLGPAADVFALGQIAHYLFTGGVAYLETADYAEWTSASVANLTADPRIPVALKPILTSALCYRPERRPRAVEIANAVANVRL